MLGPDCGKDWIRENNALTIAVGLKHDKGLENFVKAGILKGERRFEQAEADPGCCCSRRNCRSVVEFATDGVWPIRRFRATGKINTTGR